LTFVAATTLTSTFIAFDDPTGIISPFSKILNSFDCVVIGSSPISSKNIVPLSASAK
jgi:hypothetical protein